MKSNIKLIHLIDKLSVGGAERVLVDLCNIQNSNNIDVSVLTTVEPGDLIDDLNLGINRINLDRINKFSITKMYALSKIINQFDIYFNF